MSLICHRQKQDILDVEVINNKFILGNLRCFHLAPGHDHIIFRKGTMYGKVCKV